MPAPFAISEIPLPRVDRALDSLPPGAAFINLPFASLSLPPEALPASPSATSELLPFFPPPINLLVKNPNALTAKDIEVVNNPKPATAATITVIAPAQARAPSGITDNKASITPFKIFNPAVSMFNIPTVGANAFCRLDNNFSQADAKPALALLVSFNFAKSSSLTRTVSRAVCCKPLYVSNAF